MKCPICGKYKEHKNEMIEHVENMHRDSIPTDMSTAQYLYMSVHGRPYGLCRVCGQQTPWNEKAGKPFAETESDIKALAEEMGIKINGVFQPIRVAITASAVSLPLHDSISLLGLEETERRIKRSLALF